MQNSLLHLDEDVGDFGVKLLAFLLIDFGKGNRDRGREQNAIRDSGETERARWFHRLYFLPNVIDEPRPGDYYDLSSCNLIVQETTI